jgi:uncharacterized metal-binding protein YceD (DUF177 family)
MKIKVKISAIPANGLALKLNYHTESIIERLGSSSNINIIEPILIDILVTKNFNGAIASGTITFSVKQDCGRCSDNIQRNEILNYYYVFKPSDSSQMLEDDIGLAIFSGESFELNQTIEDEILLSLSPFWSPELTNNNCTYCKKNPQLLRQEDSKNKSDDYTNPGTFRPFKQLIKKP